MAVTSRFRPTSKPTPVPVDYRTPDQVAAGMIVTPPDSEKRCWMTGVTRRASKSGKGPGTIVGYAAVFEKFSQDLGGFYEKIRPGAFANVLSNDVRALKNHDSNLLLGRSTTGSLRMVEDELGLRVEIDLPDTSTGRDTATEVDDGLMDGMSFSFYTDVDEWDMSGCSPVRTIVRFRQLFDVGPVAYPAYTDTSAAMRSLDAKRSASTPPPAPAAAPVNPPAPSNVDHAPISVYMARLKVAGTF